MKPQQVKPLEFGELTLRPGESYVVVRQFQDYDSKIHKVGESWRFTGYDVFPYEFGYTLYISTSNGISAFRMQDQSTGQERILASFEQYVALAQQGVQRDGFAAR